MFQEVIGWEPPGECRLLPFVLVSPQKLDGYPLPPKITLALVKEHNKIKHSKILQVSLCDQSEGNRDIVTQT